MTASRTKGLELAASGNATELRAAKELLSAPAIPLEPRTLEGKWRCRSIQLGGIIALTTNPFFECRIVREGGDLYLEKLTGGTRRKARLVPLDGGPEAARFREALVAAADSARPGAGDMPSGGFQVPSSRTPFDVPSASPVGTHAEQA